MDDDLTTAEEPVVEPAEQSEVAADEAVPPGDTTETPPPWGEDFDAARAWSTIQHQRSRETELEQQVKQFERLQSDPEALSEFLEGLGYELASDDEEDESDDPDFDPDDPVYRLSALEQRIAEREEREAKAAEEAEFASKVQFAEQKIEEALESLNVSDELDKEWIVEKALALPPTEEGIPNIKAAHDKFIEFQNALKKRWAGSKDTSHVATGTSATQVPDLDDEQQRQAWLRERYAAKLNDS